MAHQSLTEFPIPQLGPEGFVLSVSQSQRWAGVHFCIFGLIWTTVSMVMLVTVSIAMSATVLQEPLGWFGLFPAVFLSLFVLIGVSVLGAGLLEIWTNAQLHPAELTLPKYPLRLGETCSIHYRRRLRKGTFSKPGEIEARRC